MLYLFVYLAGIIDTLNEIISVTLLFGGILALLFTALLFASKVEPDDFNDTFRSAIPKFFKTSVIISIVTAFLHIAVPPKAVIYQIAGIYCGKQINQQIHIDKKLQKVSEIIDLQLDKNIKELQKGE